VMALAKRVFVMRIAFGLFVFLFQLMLGHPQITAVKITL
jgi:hypothetical protein